VSTVQWWLDITGQWQSDDLTLLCASSSPKTYGALQMCFDWLIDRSVFICHMTAVVELHLFPAHTHTHTCILRFNGHFPRWISVASCPLYSPLFITKLHILLYRPKLCMSSLTLFHQVGLGRPLRLLLCQLTTLYSASRPSHVSTFYMSKPS